MISALASVAAMVGSASENGSLPDVPPPLSSDQIHVPAFDLPGSYFLDTETRREAQAQKGRSERCAGFRATDPENVARMRECLDKNYYEPFFATFARTYPTRIQRERIGGVQTEVLVPAEGVGTRNKSRVLINLHGGSYMYGGRGPGGRAESIPIAAVGKIKVVSVDYRMAPEHKFPAATDDVVAVYQSLLKTYEPRNIGIYGCSAGAVLTAQALARFQQLGLPRPGAAGMFGGSAHPFFGDAYFITQAMSGSPSPPAEEQKRYASNPYVSNVNLEDPSFFPGKSSAFLAAFPPSLLMSATRDVALSSVVVTHSQLTRLHVEADLHVWEGVGHCFHLNPNLAASREAYDVVTRFFDTHLGH